MGTKLSPLRVRVFDTCRLRYRYQYVDRIRARLRIGDTAGSLVHRVLSDFFSKAPASERTSGHMLRMFDEGWRALSPRYLQIAGVEALHAESRAQLERFAREADLAAQPIRVEEYIEVEIADGVVLFGRMDRIDEEPDGTLHIIDYKTGIDAHEADPTQLRLYAILVEQKLERTVSKGSFWFLDDGTTWTTDLSASDKLEVRTQLLITVNDMLAVSEFPATLGSHCRHCPYLYACEHRAEINYRLESGEW